MKTLSFDFRIIHERGGSGILLRPLTREGRNWIHDNVAGETSWLGGNLWVELRYVSELLHGIVGDGLSIAPLS